MTRREKAKYKTQLSSRAATESQRRVGVEREVYDDESVAEVVAAERVRGQTKREKS